MQDRIAIQPRDLALGLFARPTQGGADPLHRGDVRRQVPIDSIQQSTPQRRFRQPVDGEPDDGPGDLSGDAAEAVRASQPSGSPGWLRHDLSHDVSSVPSVPGRDSRQSRLLTQELGNRLIVHPDQRISSVGGLAAGRATRDGITAVLKLYHIVNMFQSDSVETQIDTGYRRLRVRVSSQATPVSQATASADYRASD